MLPKSGVSQVTNDASAANDAKRVQTGASGKINWAVMVALTILVAGVTGLALGLAPNLRADRAPVTTGDARGFDQQMIRIAERLQCPICQGQSVAFSNSPLAGEMRRLVLEKLQAGESEAQIMQYFVDRYGVNILRDPPWQGLNFWLWVTPAVGIVVGVVGLIWALRRMAKAQQLAAATQTSNASAPLLDPDVQALVAQYDREFLA